MKCRIVLNKAELKLKSQVRFPWTKIKEISGVRFPEGAGNFPLRHRVQNSSGAHPASYPAGTRCSFPGDKAARA
jgi:hypothetical protein